ALGCDPIISPTESKYKFTRIGTDSRSIQSNHLFLALKGENFDGHAFIKDLIAKGVKGFITQKGYLESLAKNTREQFEKNGLTIFEIQNTLSALGKLARYQRLRADVKVLAITGSSGKTTTRKIAEKIFNTQFHTLATKGNYNNEIGLPLTLLNLSASHEWAIVEMGMNHAGEISRLSKIALPDIAMVTNTAGVHLEGLGSVNNVAKAKAEIFEGLNINSTAIIPGSDPRREILETKARENKNIKNFLFFGQDENNDICGSDIKADMNSTEFSININNKKLNFSINSPALFMVGNSLAAICAAMSAGISFKGMQAGIKAFNPVPGRMHIYKLNGSINIIDDTYNANPASVTAALETLNYMSKDKNSIAVLGDMLELGDKSDMLHWQIGQKAASLGINKLFIFGTKGEHILKGAMENKFLPDNIYHGPKNNIVQKILEHINEGTWLLVKGSRGMAMETIINELKHKLLIDS
ncbi:MAG: UDP-N-acetylmuramoyl-tripeptide--D-alanyl-D-alanine ligase, partial [Desulfobacula sp.]|nr:UDP-N-acetylmuramoyl-tripeptide--D-alanyl-D-alanine ligase [Desulfobacula sp.]